MDRAALIAAMEVTAAEKPVAVTVPKWGTVYVRQVTVAEVDEQQADTDGKDADGKADKNRIARGACRVLCDADGVRMFDPANPADVALMAKQPWPLLRKVLAASDADTAPAGNA